MIQAICWVLIHSLWQGVLLALAGGAVILCTKRVAAAVRYRLLCGLAGIFLGGMGGTFLYEWRLAAETGDGIGAIGVSMNWLGDWCNMYAFQVVAVWLTVAILKSVRMAAGWTYIRRMRREGFAAPALWVERVGLLSRQLSIPTAVKLVESALVRVPMVVGQLRPIIYIPLGLINHLPASEMEAVLLHELAHIRRYDHLANMLQQAAECLLFFNPGFLWISSLIREERENCCDDIAIAHTRDRVEFVRALVRFKEHSMRGMALAFPGNKRQLLHRVVRISRQENKTLSGRERLVLLGGCLVIFCLLVARVDVKKKAEPVAEKRLAVVQLAQEQLAKSSPVTGVPRETIAVLEERERVSQNLEWVKTQLDQLHHKPIVKKKTRGLDQEALNAERAKQIQRERDLIAEQAELDGRQVDQARQEVELDGREVDQARQEVAAQNGQEEAERDKLQADKDREQADLDRQQAERDRHQGELDRLQAEQDRLQAERDRKQAELEREEADKDRDRAARERQQQAEQNRKQVEREKQQAERDRQKSKNN